MTFTILSGVTVRFCFFLGPEEMETSDAGLSRDSVLFIESVLLSSNRISRVTDMPIALLRLDNVVIDRPNARWQLLLNLAKLLLGERFQTTSSGAARGFSLLFEMSTLFEEYIARMLSRALAGTGRHVVAQGGRLYCLETSDGAKLFQTKPDVLVKRNGVVEHVIDTKWKRICRHTEDPKQGVAQSDVYQMMAYGQLYQCPRMILLYPHHGALGDVTMNAVHRIAIKDRNNWLQLATVTISTNKGTADQLRKLCLST
jgi:5-methylcytosine-specific restriction enzyme subunit McrC